MEYSLPKIDTDLSSISLWKHWSGLASAWTRLSEKRGLCGAPACAQTRGSQDKVTPGLGTLYTLAKSFALWSLSATL